MFAFSSGWLKSFITKKKKNLPGSHNGPALNSFCLEKPVIQDSKINRNRNLLCTYTRTKHSIKNPSRAVTTYRISGYSHQETLPFS